MDLDTNRHAAFERLVAAIDRLRGSRVDTVSSVVEAFDAWKTAHEAAPMTEERARELADRFFEQHGDDEAGDANRHLANLLLSAARGGDVPAGEMPTCVHCGKPPTCIGRYEDSKEESYACDECCGHGNEDGYCKPVGAAPTPEPAAERGEDHEDERDIATASRWATQAYATGYPSDAQIAAMLPLVREARAEIEEANSRTSEAEAGERISEERTDTLWHAIEALSTGDPVSDETWGEHVCALDMLGIDREPLDAIRGRLRATPAPLTEEPNDNAAMVVRLEVRIADMDDNRAILSDALKWTRKLMRRDLEGVHEVQWCTGAARLTVEIRDEDDEGEDASRGDIPAEVRAVGTTTEEHRGHGCELDPDLGRGDPLVDRVAADWRPTVGARVVTVKRLDKVNLNRRPSALGTVRWTLENVMPETVWWVRHDDGTEAPYDTAELRPPYVHLVRGPSETRGLCGVDTRETDERSAVAGTGCGPNTCPKCRAESGS